MGQMPIVSRRKALTMLMSAVAGSGVYALPRLARGQEANGLRGGMNAAGFPTVTAKRDSGTLARRIAKAAAAGESVFLPPGIYEVSGLDLPDGTRLHGVSGATRLVFTGERAMLRAAGARRIELSGLVIDGVGRRVAGDQPALVDMREVQNLFIDGCEFFGSAGTGIQIERCGGRIDRNRIAEAADYGILALDSSNLSITANTVTACGNGGILVHRWNKGADGTLVSGNRVTATGATRGGTGQYGNAINIYRADGVQVIGNHLSGSAFSAIRSNAGSNIQIADNQCLSSGETAIYSEFGFEGAVVSGNIVDGAANGISIVNFNEGGRMAAVTGNVVRNLSLRAPYQEQDTFFGLGISVEADTAVSGNIIENAPRFGLLLGWGPYLRNVVVTGNVVRQAGTGCAVSVAEGAGGAVIASNVFEKVEKGGVIGYRWREAASGELALDAAGFSHLTVTGNRVA